MDYGRRELADRLAAQYVAGTLRGRARRRFEALLPAHALLRGAVREWQARLMPLTAAVAPQTPSPAVWLRIEQRLFGAASPTVAAPAAGGFWRGLAFWRSLAGVASVAAVALALLLANPQPVPAPIVVVLAPAAPGADLGPTNAGFVASISPDGRSMVTRPVQQVKLDPGRALELWSVPRAKPGQPAEAPKSLGVVSADGTTVVRRGDLLADTDALALSLEPSGGSPTGKATGPILYVGKIQR